MFQESVQSVKEAEYMIHERKPLWISSDYTEISTRL